MVFQTYRPNVRKARGHRLSRFLEWGGLTTNFVDTQQVDSVP